MSATGRRLGFDRPPRLRRIAELVDAQADGSSSPALARALACKLRLRAAALEAGTEAEETLDEETRELRQINDELSADP